MPTPEVFRTGEIDLFEVTPGEERHISLPVIYATNRKPYEDVGERGYTKFSDDNLRLGVATIQIGDDPDLSWEELRALSTTEERSTDIPLRLTETVEYLTLAPDIDPRNPPEEVEELLAAVDQALRESADPDILIFVHGAMNNYYRSVAQAAQYRHFTGHNSVVLAFVWPSQGNVVYYGDDVRYANQAAPLLAKLVELLGTHTQARYINLLGYSLGATVLSHGLNRLRDDCRDEDLEALRERLRIGEVYFTAADIDLGEFTQQLLNYQDMVGRVSLTANLSDSALHFSQIIHGSSRAGRPDADDLTEEEIQNLVEMSWTPRFDIIEIGSAARAYDALEAHDYWYSNPMVSTDILIQMLSHADPSERGLLPLDTERDVEAWYFPEDHKERAIEAVKAIREERARNASPEP